jgi:hypothetical protein
MDSGCRGRGHNDAYIPMYIYIYIYTYTLYVKLSVHNFLHTRGCWGRGHGDRDSSDGFRGRSGALACQDGMYVCMYLCICI